MCCPVCQKCLDRSKFAECNFLGGLPNPLLPHPGQFTPKFCLRCGDQDDQDPLNVVDPRMRYTRGNAWRQVTEVIGDFIGTV